MKSLGFSIYSYYIICKYSFTSSFLISMPLISFSCLIALTRTSNTILTNKRLSSHHALTCDALMLSQDGYVHSGGGTPSSGLPLWGNLSRSLGWVSGAYLFGAINHGAPALWEGTGQAGGPPPSQCINFVHRASSQINNDAVQFAKKEHQPKIFKLNLFHIWSWVLSDQH